MAWYQRLLNLTRLRRVSREIERELQFHIAERIDDLEASGMPAKEAHRVAKRQFGNYTLQKERTRDMDVLSWLESVAADIRYGIRGSLQTPVFAVVAILTLALGIGANTALFSAADGILLEKLKVQRPDELVTLRWTGNYNPASTSTLSYGEWADAPDGSGPFSYFAFDRFRQESQTLSEVFAFAPESFDIQIAQQRVEAEAQFVSGNYYRALGVSTIRGRTLVPEDDMATAPPAAVISEGHWQRRFGGDPSTIGKTIVIHDVPFTIVGVVPESTGDLLRPRNPAPEISVPLAMEPLLRGDAAHLVRPATWWLVVMGRLAPWASLSQVEAELGPVLDAIVPDEPPPATRQIANPAPPVFSVIPANRGVYDPDPDEVTALTIFFAVFGVILAIVCVNLVNLSLSRGETRQREVAVRMAIGAARGRIIRQMLTESMVLAILGGAAGLIVAAACQYLLPVAAFPIQEFQIDSTSLWFAAGISVLTSLCFGLAPAVRATNSGRVAAIRTATGSVMHTRRRFWLGKSLVAVQVALSLVLLVGAGLLLRTVSNLRDVAVGFNPDNVLVYELDGDTLFRRYSPQQVIDINERVLERVMAIPGVQLAALANRRFLGGMNTGTTIALTDWESDRRRERVNVVVAGPNFFETMEISLRLGRTFTRQDYETGPQVAVVNEAFVRQFLPSNEPIGRGIRNGPASTEPVFIVGVVADTKYADLREGTPPVMYLSDGRQPGWLPFRANVFHVRTHADLATIVPAIRQAVKEIDPAISGISLLTQRQVIAQAYNTEWVYANLSAVFGALALLISMIGLFGLMSYLATQRTKEIGIRIALGAQAGQIRGAVLRESLIFVGVGVVVGTGISLIATRSLETFLFGLAPGDPVTIVTSVILMIVAAVLASYLPARRASSVDPMVALRHE